MQESWETTKKIISNLILIRINQKNNNLDLLLIREQLYSIIEVEEEEEEEEKLIKSYIFLFTEFISLASNMTKVVEERKFISFN